MALSFSASATLINFDIGAEGIGVEFGASSIIFVPGGVTITATGTFDSNNVPYDGVETPAYAYLDGDANGNAGLGVCQTLNGNQCTPNSDDNVTYGETLRLVFDQVVTFDAITFTNGNHGTSFAADADIVITSGGYINTLDLTSTFDVSPLSSGTVFEFYNPNTGGGSNVSNDYQFYLNNITFSTGSKSISEVPAPAAVWLMGSGLLGMIGFARRRKYK